MDQGDWIRNVTYVRDVRLAVAVKIPDYYCAWGPPRGICERVLQGEGAVAVAEEARNAGIRNSAKARTTAARDYEVQLAIAVEVGYRDHHRPRDSNRGVKRESAVAVAKQDRNRIAARVCNCNVGDTIAVEIAHRDPLR